MILVDTSLWIDHLRSRNARLVAALEWQDVAMHPFVLGELACGNLTNRKELMGHWAELPMAPVATDAEALTFIEMHKLMGLGLGYVDVHLLAAAALAGDMVVWTRDAALGRAASKLGLN